MKSMLFLLFLLSSSLTANASDTTITFIQHQYGDIIEMAEKERKDILLYFHFTGCGACRLMEKTTFKDPQVIDYFQKHFINAEVNTLEGIGVETNKIFNVQLHPTFIFLDDSGNELHRIVGKFNPEEFLNHAQRAQTRQNSLPSFQEKYSQGDRHSEFLLEYVYLLRDAVLLDSTMIHEYLHSIQPVSYEMEKNVRFIYEFCIYRNRIITPLASPAFQFLYQNKEKFYNHFEKDQVDARIVRIINQAIYQAIEEQDEAAFNNGLDLIREYDTGQQYEYKEMDGRVTAMLLSTHLILSAQMEFYQQGGDIDRYRAVLAEYMQKIWNDSRQLNSIAWTIFEQSTDPATLRDALKCAERSVHLNRGYNNTDTYAWLLFKLDHRKKAKRQALKAIEIAKSTDRDFSGTSDLLHQLEK